MSGFVTMKPFPLEDHCRASSFRTAASKSEFITAVSGLISPLYMAEAPCKGVTIPGVLVIRLSKKLPAGVGFVLRPSIAIMFLRRSSRNGITIVSQVLQFDPLTDSGFASDLAVSSELRAFEQR